jgi:pimeloyl-ACP methyl ester carboxylesterase
VPAQRVASVTTPTLVLTGGASPPWLHDTARAMVGLLPQGRHRVLEGQEHNVAPEAIAPALEEFFAG